jgi:hypothetical protein
MRRSLFRRPAGRIRFFNFVANRMKIVRSRNHGEQQHHEATEENNGAETTRVPETSRANGLASPDQNSWPHQSQPKKIEK